jgi:hypothetical protein
MSKRRLLFAEHRSFVVERYLADVPPRELVDELAEKFGVVVKPSALRQWITRSGLAKRRAELDRKTCSLVSRAKVNALAKTKASEPVKHIENWALRTVGVTERAIEMAEGATKPRELASAVAAMSTGIRLYRLLVGIDGPGSGGPKAANFNFNFAAIVPKRVEDGLPYNSDVPVGSRRIEVRVEGEGDANQQTVVVTESPAIRSEPAE